MRPDLAHRILVLERKIQAIDPLLLKDRILASGQDLRLLEIFGAGQGVDQFTDVLYPVIVRFFINGCGGEGLSGASVQYQLVNDFGGTNILSSGTLTTNSSGYADFLGRSRTRVVVVSASKANYENIPAGSTTIVDPGLYSVVEIDVFIAGDGTNYACFQFCQGLYPIANGLTIHVGASDPPHTMTFGNPDSLGNRFYYQPGAGKQYDFGSRTPFHTDTCNLLRALGYTETGLVVGGPCPLTSVDCAAKTMVFSNPYIGAVVTIQGT
jgi:hypothetical protein